MPAELLELHPAVPQAWWWWLVLASLFLVGAGLALVGLLRWRTLSRVEQTPVDDSLVRLRAAALGEVAAADQGDPMEQARLIGRAVRRFAGVAVDGDADYQTTAQLRIAAAKDPDLVEVFEISATVDRLAYRSASEAEVAALAERAREVILAWR